jgi:hypothetical protein
MKSLFVAFAVVFATQSAFAFGPSFPQGPSPVLTPGKLCDNPSKYRYPEHIAYCDRDVTYETKEALIHNYDSKLGFHIGSMSRYDFKIDHFIPLCAGGSNDSTNLWPQHKSVYELTDPVEPLLCEKMANGRLSQADAVKLIVKAKTDLATVPEVMKILRKL